MFMKKIIGVLAALLSVFIIFSSCNLDNGTTNPQTGYFMVANVSHDAPHLNVYINTAPFDTGLAYGTYTPYVSATAGVYNFSFYPAGSSTSVLDNSVTVAANKVYSYFVIDSFSKIKTAFVEDNIIAPSGDSAFLRFFDFTPNFPQPVNVWDSAANAGAGRVLYSGRTFNDKSSNPSFADFTELKSGAYTLQIKQIDGTLLLSQAVTLEGGRVYTLFSKGFYGGTGIQALGMGQIQNYP